MADSETISARVEHHADAILRLCGVYAMDGARRAILSAVIDCYEEAYRAGAASYRAGEVGK